MNPLSCNIDSTPCPTLPTQNCGLGWKPGIVSRLTETHPPSIQQQKTAAHTHGRTLQPSRSSSAHLRSARNRSADVLPKWVPSPPSKAALDTGDLGILSLSPPALLPHPPPPTAHPKPPTLPLRNRLSLLVRLSIASVPPAACLLVRRASIAAPCPIVHQRASETQPPPSPAAGGAAVLLLRRWRWLWWWWWWGADCSRLRAKSHTSGRKACWERIVRAQVAENKFG